MKEFSFFDSKKLDYPEELESAKSQRIGRERVKKSFFGDDFEGIFGYKGKMKKVRFGKIMKKGGFFDGEKKSITPA